MRYVSASGHWSYTYTYYSRDTAWTTAGSKTWTAPAYCDSVRVRLWGGGGAGSRVTTNSRAGGGGAGGGFSQSTIANPSGEYTCVVGVAGVSAASPTNGGSSTWGTTTVVAPGGNSAAANSTTGASASAAGTGTIKWAGGSGANGSGSNAGGGGEGSDTTQNGQSASGATAGTNTGGANGGNGRTGTQGVGLDGSAPGGAGGGAYRTSTTYAGGAGSLGRGEARWYYHTVDSTWVPSGGGAPAGPETTYVVNYSPAVANGGFETTTLDGWSTYQGSGQVLDTSDAHGGSHAVNMHSWGAISLSRTVLTVGVAYTVKLWAKKYNSETSRVTVELGSGNWLDQPAMTTSWAEYTLTGTCSGDGLLRFGADATAWYVMDDIRVYVTP